jgi:hypothetical protein
MIQFDKWLSIQNFSDYPKRIFEEAIVCYKVGAFRSAFILSYNGFLLVVKERILEGCKYKNIGKNPWKDIYNSLNNDEQWEGRMKILFNANKDDSIFKLDSYLKAEVLNLREKRNRIVHGTEQEVSNVQVDYIWEFIMKKLHNFYVDGGKEYIKSSIINSFDYRKNIEKVDSLHFSNYLNEVNQIKDIMNEDEIAEFLSELHLSYEELGKYKIAKNYDSFFKGYVESYSEKLKKGLLKYLSGLERERDICEKFRYFFEKFNSLREELLQEVKYIKYVWHCYTTIIEYGWIIFDDNKWDILKIYLERNLLSEKENEIFL